MVLEAKGRTMLKWEDATKGTKNGTKPQKICASTRRRFGSGGGRTESVTGRYRDFVTDFKNLSLTKGSVLDIIVDGREKDPGIDF